jgi:hypothetical protein
MLLESRHRALDVCSTSTAWGELAVWPDIPPHANQRLIVSAPLPRASLLAANDTERIGGRVMATLLRRVDVRDVAYTGVAAGLLFIGFEMVATASLTGSATALMPLRMIGTIVLGRAALDPNYSIVAAGITGLAVHLLLSIAFAALFAEIVTRIERVTELMATNGQLALAGTMFGTALWLVNFYVIAPLAGWTWFAGNVHHVVAFLGHAFFFGCPLGWMSSGAGGLTLVRAR